MMRSTASSSVSSVMRTAKKASGPKIARTTCFWSVPSSSGRKNRDVAGKPKRLGDGDKLVREKILRAGELHVPAFVEKPPLDEFGHMRAPLQPNGGGRMAEAQDALFLGAVLAMRGRAAAMPVLVDGALDDSRGDGGVRERVDQDEAAGGAVRCDRDRRKAAAWFSHPPRAISFMSSFVAGAFSSVLMSTR